jgi:CRISPR-associated endoribonuclease Cas6
LSIAYSTVSFYTYRIKYKTKKMRIDILLKSSKSNEEIPYNYQYSLAKQIHKWIGKDNPWHDESYSSFCFGGLKGLQKRNGQLSSPTGTATWQIGSRNSQLLQALIQGIEKAPYLEFGLYVQQIQLKPMPQFHTDSVYHLDSPIFLRKKRDTGKPDQHVLYTDSDASRVLTDSLHAQLRHLGMDALVPHTQAEFLTDYPAAKTKLITLNKQPQAIKLRASVCPIRLQAPEEVQHLVWASGIGASTGIGFGMIK